MPRRPKWIPPIPKEELHNMTIMDILVRCSLAWSDRYETALDRRTTNENLYAVKEGLFAFYNLTKYMRFETDDDQMGPRLGSVIKFNEAMFQLAVGGSEHPPGNLRAALFCALEKGLDPAVLREILFWDLAEFRAAILNALHARGESILPG